MSDTITIAGNNYYSNRPTFKVLDEIKNLTGIDFAKGISDEQSNDLIKDMKKLPRVIALITRSTQDETFNEKLVDEREKFFYENAEPSDFAEAMIFFARTLTGKEKDSQKNVKELKSKMKLVKASEEVS